MFVIYDDKKQYRPIKVWLDDKEQLEESCLEQAKNLSNLPFIHKWVCLMPDTHAGFGMPIGGVIATENVIIPNAVGVDIGCGMGFIETNIHKSELNEGQYKNIVGQIMRDIPTGFKHHKEKQDSEVLDDAEKNEFFKSIPELYEEIESGYNQIGTLGGGNHFIEIQEDENGFLCVMLHSGSRNFGYKVAKYFNNIAKNLNNKWYSSVPSNYDLAFLPLDIKEGQEYIRWMNLALDFAKENRNKMMEVIKEKLKRIIPGISFNNQINAHHNYASLEKHYDKEVWVHRKGAICVENGNMGIIPGAMGSYSYIVEGLGNPEAFNSCSHGAGRKMSRKKAKELFSVEDTILDLKDQGIVLGKNNKSDVNDEIRWAYKDIDVVIEQELDLIKPIKKLKTLCVIKG
ncbi:MAG: RtcB family protein [Firmicutes bacterium]|nr:RtcB family protein [Bacillota bacterium]